LLLFSGVGVGNVVVVVVVVSVSISACIGLGLCLGVVVNVVDKRPRWYLISGVGVSVV
jgi:hypothetical protein